MDSTVPWADGLGLCKKAKFKSVSEPASSVPPWFLFQLLLEFFSFLQWLGHVSQINSSPNAFAHFLRITLTERKLEHPEV